MKITIDTDKLKQLATDGKNILLTPEAEKELVALLDMRDLIEKTIEDAKQILSTEALKLNPNFTSIVSDNVKVGFRSYGSKYYLDKSFINDIPENLYKATIKVSDADKSAIDEVRELADELTLPMDVIYSVEAKEVEKFVKENKTLPIGINEADRPKTISFSRRGENAEE